MVTNIWGSGMEFENPIVVMLDNKVIYETVIGGEEDMKLYDQVQNGALDKPNKRLKNIRFHATAGPHKVGVTFRRRTFAESDDQLQMFAAGGGQDRMYRINSFQIQGPFNPKGLASTPSRDRIFTCRPADGATGDAQARCARQIVSSLARRAYRRPVTEEDVNELMRYYEEGVKSGGFESGVRSAVTGMLASPFFLYRSERVPAGVRPGDTYAITDLELASKLSFFLWNTIPDDELLTLAAAGGCASRGARSAGAAHAGGPALRDAGRQLHAAVAGHEAPGRDPAGLGRAAVCARAGRTRATTSAPSWRSSPTACSARTAAWSTCCARSTRSSTSAWRCTTASPT